MIYAIIYNKARLSGRVALKGEHSKVLNEFRLIARAICDYYGPEVVLKWTAGLANDNNMVVGLGIDITSDQGGEYIPEEVRSSEQT